MQVFDYKHNEFDLAISGGDFVLAESTEQHLQLLLLLDKGELKQHPLLGVGIRGFILDDRSLTELEAVACAAMEEDGVTIASFAATDWTDIVIEGEYEG